MSVAALVLYNEARKGMVITWGYRANLATELLTLFFVFIFVSYFLGGGSLEAELLPGMLLGYLVWFYAAIALSSMSTNLTGEALTGTLEQLYMSPMPSWLIFVGRVISTFLTTTVMVAILALTLALVLRISFPFRLEALPPFVLTMVGLFGFGYAIGGLVLVYKQIGAVNNLVTNMLLFMNGALLPVNLFPGWLETFARLLPTTQGIVVMRKVIIDGESLAAVWADGSMVYLAVQSTIFLLAGWVIFNIGERFAKRRGTLGQY